MFNHIVSLTKYELNHLFILYWYYIPIPKSDFKSFTIFTMTKFIN